MRILPFTLFIIIACMACNMGKSKTGNHQPDSLAQLQHDSLKVKTSSTENLKAIAGYRFIIKGDFNGDGKEDVLTEHYFSNLDHKETNKLYDEEEDLEQLRKRINEKKPYAFVSCNDANIDTLQIASQGQLLGLAYLKNEGDLNGDGTDEVSYVIDWADYSSMNTWHIVTYKNNRWQEVYNFEIREWQLPQIPQTINQYGPMGLDKKLVVPANDSLNTTILNNLNSFKGLVKKIAPGKIQVTYINTEVEEDTKIVKLK